MIFSVASRDSSCFVDYDSETNTYTVTGEAPGEEIESMKIMLMICAQAIVSSVWEARLLGEPMPELTDHEHNIHREDYRYRDAKDQFEMLEQDLSTLMRETDYLDE